VEVQANKGGPEFKEWLGGYFEPHWSVNPHWTANFKALPKHPVTSGVNPFSTNDEWYYHMRFRDKMDGVTTILTDLPPVSTLDRPDGTHSGNPHPPTGLTALLAPVFARVFRPLLDEEKGARNRGLLGVAVALLIALSVALPTTGLVRLKMLPFDNKSEFQVVVDMPVGTPLEQTAAVLRDLGSYLATVPEVTDYQAYTGMAAPINFNGLVRQYYLRAGSELGDIQVNLTDKHARQAQSHAIAMRVRPELQAIGARYGANVKVVEVPPGPPVLSPIVAEIYGPDADGRRQVARCDPLQQIVERAARAREQDSQTKRFHKKVAATKTG
jgi:hypothetical protein